MKLDTAYCPICKKQVAIQKNSPNHVVHLILSLLTGGFWLIIWLLVSLFPGEWHCTQCGHKFEDQLLPKWIYKASRIIMGIFFLILLLSLITGGNK